MFNIQKCMKQLTSDELYELTCIVDHEALSEEVRARFKRRYEEMAFAYYNNEYALVGSITELGVEDHSLVAYKELTEELVPYIKALL